MITVRLFSMLTMEKAFSYFNYLFESVFGSLEPKRPTALVGSLKSWDYELSNGVKIFVGLLGPGGHLGGQRGGILEL